MFLFVSPVGGARPDVFRVSASTACRRSPTRLRYDCAFFSVAVVYSRASVLDGRRSSAERAVYFQRVVAAQIPVINERNVLLCCLGPRIRAIRKDPATVLPRRRPGLYGWPRALVSCMDAGVPEGLSVERGHGNCGPYFCTVYGVYAPAS